ESAPAAAKMALGWASRGVDVESIDARRKAIDLASSGGLLDERALALERFATEVAGGDPDAAAAALSAIDDSSDGDLAVAAALARLAWSHGTADTREAADRVGARGPRALIFSLAEQTRIARDSGDRAELTRAARRWFEAGGNMPAALEWLAGATASGDATEERDARLALAAMLQGDAREAMLASAALVQARAEPNEHPPLGRRQSAAG